MTGCGTEGPGQGQSPCICGGSALCLGRISPFPSSCLLAKPLTDRRPQARRELGTVYWGSPETCLPGHLHTWSESLSPTASGQTELLGDGWWEVSVCSVMFLWQEGSWTLVKGDTELQAGTQVTA